MMKVDKDLISKRFSKAVGTYDGAAAVQDAIAERMVGAAPQPMAAMQWGKFWKSAAGQVCSQGNF